MTQRTLVRGKANDSAGKSCDSMLFCLFAGIVTNAAAHLFVAIKHFDTKETTSQFRKRLFANFA